jgi:hypothetical protein
MTMTTGRFEAVIKWRTPGVISGAVRDPDRGIVDVEWTSSCGWRCPCGPRGEIVCEHVRLVQRLTAP